MIQLRPYQQEARHKINALLNSGRAPVFVSPTGTGKTITAVQIILDRVNQGQRVFVLTPQEEIFDQWVLAFTHTCAPYGTINDKGVQGRDKPIYICMPLSLNNILSKLPERFAPDVIVTDECHHSEADSWQAIYNFYPHASRLGLTATPQRTDGLGLDNTYTDIVRTIDMPTAIDDGYLAQPLLIVPEQYKLELDIPDGSADYSTEQQAEQLGKTQIIGDVIQQYSNIFAGLPVLVACSTYEHARKMTEEFNSAGWNFDHIHSNLNKAERRRMLREIRSGKLNGLCTVGIGIEGMDIPGLHGLIWLRRTKSVTIYLQFIGRVLRPAEGKTYGIILDPVGNVFIHGRPEMHREWSLSGRVKRDDSGDLVPQMKICPVCRVMNAKQNVVCHICGFNFSEDTPPEGTGRGFPAMVDGKLVILDAEELGQHRDEIKEKLQAQREQRTGSKPEPEPVKISRQEKVDILRNGLEKKSGIFTDAVQKFL